MKRDFQLIRKILERSEEISCSTGYSWNELAQQFNVDVTLLRHNVKLSSEQSLVRIDYTMSGPIFNGLTYAGHDFLDAMRNDTVWNKFIAYAKNLPFDAFKNALNSQMVLQANEILRSIGIG